MEFKFRAWHKTQKAFMYFELGELDDSMITKVEDGWYLEDCELMQYIGCKDKNEKEIFEGDIVVTENEQQGEYPVEDTFRGVVTYQDAMFKIVQLHNTYTPCLKNYTIVSIEIIGNIYENPELLNKEL